MVQEQDQVPEADFGDSGPSQPAARRRRWRAAAFVVVALALIAGLTAWLMRKDIAANLIGGELDSLGLPAQYDIASIGPSQQVIRNLVIGDPRHPDLTVEELRVETRLYWGLPGIGRITAVRPRLFGSVRGGKPSFGSLDKVLFGGAGGPFEMPDLDVAVVDGRALVLTDFGRVAARLEGQGALAGGFSGELAVVAPDMVIQGWTADRATLYGTTTTASQKPRFDGPVRIASLSCPDRNFALGKTDLQLGIQLDKALDGGEGEIGFTVGVGQYSGTRLGSASGTVNFSYRKQALNARYDIAARAVRAQQASIAKLQIDGRARTAGGFDRFDVDADVSGTGLALGNTLGQLLAQAEEAGESTFVAPVVAKVRAALARETRGSTIAANLIARRSAEGVSLVVPHGALRGGSGAALLALSRVQAMFRASAFPRITGNFATGGAGLPKISGRMETSSNGALAMRVHMPEYAAGTTRMALPQLALTQAANGSVRFDGQARLTGDLPGGHTENLQMPLQGVWAADGGLALWPHCTQVRFDGLRFANLSIERRAMSVCPAFGGAVVALRDGAMRIAAGVPSLDLAGRLGATPIRIVSGPLGYAQIGGAPGVVRASALSVQLGPPQSASRFTVADLSARVGKAVAGSFDEADISLFAVPLDLRKAAGNWRYDAGALTIDNASFVLADREKTARFNPMTARDAVLQMIDNVISAQAVIREPASDRKILRVDLTHDLGSATGHANLYVDDIAFGEELQADTLSALALGVVSNLQGEVHGAGRIDWNPQAVTSRGRFATAGIDFAAPFGPVKGLSGEVAFTDLLGFVTAPNQTLHMASVNPGIEVSDGTISFEMKPGYYLQINGGKWPFMQGTLTLEPAHMQIGIAETRYYTLKVSGLDAATFVQHLEMSNLTATGVFDGEVPLIFDENGGRVENGVLISRSPGGSLSYVGELTYKDLSAMGNFAFDALKSVNYNKMQIGLGGSLTGDIVTRVSFDGLSQGVGATRNFLTKQIAKLPLRFVLNVRAPFFSLFGSVRSLYDPEYITDPRTLGLVDRNGIVAPAPPAASLSSIQPSVSENTP